jgi:cytochrome o ubiquinol oxidase operon protein cyoD
VDADTAPDAREGKRDKLRSYLMGVSLSVVLTVLSFAAASTHLVWGPSIPVLLAVLAIAQMGVHLVFFLHVSSSPDSTNTILALAFGVFVVALVIFGSMIIMWNLNSHMVPMNMLEQMQR